MKNSLKTFFAIAFCAAVLVGCKKDKPLAGDSYNVTPTEIAAVSANGGSFDLTVKANLAWTASANVDWIKVAPAEGTGDAEVKVTVESNVAEAGQCAPSRSGVVTFKFGGHEVAVAVSQDEEAVVFVALGEGTDITYKQTKVVVKVEHNITYDIDIPAEATWLTQDPVTKAAATDEVVFTAAKNKGEARSATIKFTGSNGSEQSVTVNQGEYEGIAPDGASEGLFSVSASKQVFFALGNVQATVTFDDIRFAANQWDVLGVDAEWTDLFSYDVMMQAASALPTWSLLSSDEWDYLLTGRDGAAAKNGLAVINDGSADHFGLVIMPDVFAGTIPASFSAAEWASFEGDNNAIFLPAAGYSYGVNIAGVGEGGSYWSLTDNGSVNAYGIDFDSVSIYSKSNSLRTIGQAVRPVVEYSAN